jgi:hypothetical protein
MPIELLFKSRNLKFECGASPHLSAGRNVRIEIVSKLISIFAISNTSHL